MMRRLVTALAVLVGGLALVAVAPSTVGAQESTTTSVEVRDQDSGVGDILPRPGSGEAPDSPNDRGGWQQYMVFALIIAGLAVLVLLVRRESTRALAQRAARAESDDEG